MNRNTLPTALTPGAFINPHTGQLVVPGKVLGYRKDGRPIYAIAGGDGTGDDGTGPGDDGNTGTGSDGGKEADGTGDGKKPEIKGEVDPDRAARAIQAARDAEKKAKDRAKAADDRLAAVLKAAGLTPDGKQDPAEQLAASTAAAEKATAKARETAIELAVYKRAGKAGADADAVLDSRGFLSSVADLDPDAADFGDQVVAAIKAAIKANPKLAATTAGPGKQGADHSGSGGQKNKPKTLAEAVTAALSRN